MTTTTEKNYKIVNGTSYDERTPDAVIQILENSRANKTRLRLHYGDTETGRDWNEENDVTGHIGRSTGNVKIPLTIDNSDGGPGVLDHCIVRIRLAKAGGNDLYRHPKYHQGAAVAIVADETIDGRKFRSRAEIDGSIHARFSTPGGAARWIKKMGFNS